LPINYGLLTDHRGCPVALSVVEGQTADPKTLLPQGEKVRDRFGIRELVLVGDRGMIAQTQIETLRTDGGVDWITARRAGAIRTLLEAEAIPCKPGEQYQLCELWHPDYPAERLIACYNPVLARQRDHRRQALLEATTQELEKVQGMMARGQLKGPDQIGLRAGKGINKYKVAKPVALTIEAATLQFQLDAARLAAARALDGL
jgi:transposase